MLVCFSDAGWMATGRKSKESRAIVCVSAGVSEESIVTIASVGSLSQSICRHWGRQSGESDAANLWAHKGEREGWSRIEPRILDSRVPQKASIRARTASVLISTDASLVCGGRRRVDCISFLPRGTARGGVHGRGGGRGHAAERFAKTGSLWTDREGSANQGACRPLCSRSGLFLYPHSSVYSIYSWSLSSFYFMVSLFKGLPFVLWKAERLNRPFVEWTYCWIVEIVSCTETLAKSWVKQNRQWYNSLLEATLRVYLLLAQ